MQIVLHTFEGGMGEQEDHSKTCNMISVQIVLHTFEGGMEQQGGGGRSTNPLLGETPFGLGLTTNIGPLEDEETFFQKSWSCVVSHPLG